MLFFRSERVRFVKVKKFEEKTSRGEKGFGSTDLKKMIFYTNRYVPFFCDKTLVWYESTYDWFDLGKWEGYEKNRDQYIENAQIVTFSDIYRSIGCKK